MPIEYTCIEQQAKNRRKFLRWRWYVWDTTDIMFNVEVFQKTFFINGGIV